VSNTIAMRRKASLDAVSGQSDLFPRDTFYEEFCASVRDAPIHPECLEGVNCGRLGGVGMAGRLLYM
jgi:hypothetical protein